MTIVLKKYHDNEENSANIEIKKDSKLYYLSIHNKYGQRILNRNYMTMASAKQTMKRLFPGMNEEKEGV